MSAAQSGSRRHSARLQQKDDTNPTNGAPDAKGQINPVKITHLDPTTSKKRKPQHSEDDDGFVFSRVKKKPQHAPSPVLVSEPEPNKQNTKAKADSQDIKSHSSQQQSDPQEPPKKKRRRMSFSTPVKKQPAVRRSKRLSTDTRADQESPIASKIPEVPDLKVRKVRREKATIPGIQPAVPPTRPAATKVPKPSPQRVDRPIQLNTDEAIEIRTEHHSPTKIALPFADTPVISRNKAMRDGRSSKNERRSSLGLRGRRASSLIDSGTSNALPHLEVDAKEFYKHIESDLLEPKRMKQLLTWCATRAMHPKPQGADFEESSATSAARVIEEELIKELSNQPELSNWFSREEDPASLRPLPQRPHPKNLSNTTKANELEEQIKRLRSEKEALEALLRPPEIPSLIHYDHKALSNLDQTRLNDSDLRTMKLIEGDSALFAEIGLRVNKVVTSLGPAIDTFADGVHKIDQYRAGADVVASQILAICANKLSERERIGKQKAAEGSDTQTSGNDVSSILRGLSKIESAAQR